MSFISSDSFNFAQTINILNELINTQLKGRLTTGHLVFNKWYAVCILPLSRFLLYVYHIADLV